MDTRAVYRNSCGTRCRIVFWAAWVFAVFLATPSVLLAQPPACTIPGLSGGPSIAGSQRFSVVNNCGKNVVLLFNAGDCSSQWGEAFGSDTVSYYSVSYSKTVIAAGSTQNFCIPNAGACSGGMFFAYNCQGDDPTSTCDISGDPGIFTHTLAEFTAGCKDMLYGHEGDNPPYAPCSANMSDGHSPKWLMGPVDSFDISAVNGYTLPMTMTVSANSTVNCNTLAADGSMLDLASCPKEYGYNTNSLQTFSMTPADAIAYASTTNSILSNNPSGISLLSSGLGADGVTTINKSCASPCKWFSSTLFGNPANTQALGSASPGTPNTYDFYCCVNTCGQATCGDPDPNCTCSGPGCRGKQCSKGPIGTYKYSIVTTNFVTRLKEVGYANYTWQYDDAFGNKQCSWSDPNTVNLASYTLTLCPNGGDPTSISNKWKYDASSSRCVVDNNIGTYNSLFECMTTDPTASTKFKLISDVIIGNEPNYPDGVAKYCQWSPSDGTMTLSSCLQSATQTSMPPIELLLMNGQ